MLTLSHNLPLAEQIRASLSAGECSDWPDYGLSVDDTLDLALFQITSGDRVIARKVESERAKQAHSKARHRRYLNDPLVRAGHGD